MKKFKKFISIIVLVSFVLSLVAPSVGAQNLPAMVTTGFQPPVLLGLKIHPENPLLFDFIVDKGEVPISEDELKSETEKLVKYFLAALTIPDKEVWVNLSPNEENRIIPDVLAQTMMGKTMLEQDYMLKQLAASLTNPETKIGKEYWQKAGMAAPTLSKVWIVPQKAQVLESDGIVLVGEKSLRVKMQEENTEIFQDLILPVINKEVNESKDFADVRQIYNSVILATWYKQALKESLLGKVYADKGKVAGVETDDKDMKQRIYEQYLEAFKKGAYNLIQEQEDAVTGEVIPRKYFSGGITPAEFGQGASSALTTKEVSRGTIQGLLSRARAVIVQVLGRESQKSDPSEEYHFLQGGDNGNYYMKGDLSNGILYRVYETVPKDEYTGFPGLRETKILDILALEGLSDLAPQFLEGGLMRSPAVSKMILDSQQIDMKGYLKRFDPQMGQRIVSLTAWAKQLPERMRKYFGQSSLEKLRGFFSTRAMLDELLRVYDPTAKVAVMSIGQNAGDLAIIKENARKVVETAPYIALAVPPDAQFLTNSAIWDSSSFLEKIDALIDFAEALDLIHEAGIIHNNIYSGSVLVSRQNGQMRLILVDFSSSYLPGQEKDPKAYVQSQDPNARYIDMFGFGFMMSLKFDKSKRDFLTRDLLERTIVAVMGFKKDDPVADMGEVADRLRILRRDYLKLFNFDDFVNEGLFDPKDSSASSGVSNEQEQKEKDFAVAISNYRAERIKRALTTISWWAEQKGYYRPFMLRDNIDYLIRKSPEFQDETQKVLARKFVSLLGTLIQYGLEPGNKNQQRMFELLGKNYDEFSAFYDLAFHEELTSLNGTYVLYSHIAGDVSFHSDLFIRASALLNEAQEKEFVERYRAQYPEMTDFFWLEGWAFQQDQKKTSSGKIWDDLIEFTKEKIIKSRASFTRRGGVLREKEAAAREERNTVDAITDDFFLEELLPRLKDKSFKDRAILNLILRQVFYNQYYIYLWGGETVEDVLARPIEPAVWIDLTTLDLPERGRMNKSEVKAALQSLGFDDELMPDDAIREPLAKALTRFVASSAMVLDQDRQQLVSDAAQKMIQELLPTLAAKDIPDEAVDFVGIVLMTVFAGKWYEKHPVVGGDGKLYNLFNTDILGLSSQIFENFASQRKFLNSLGVTEREFLANPVLAISDPFVLAVNRTFSRLQKQIGERKSKVQRSGEVVVKSEAEKLAHTLLIGYDQKVAAQIFARMAQPAAFVLTQTTQGELKLSDFVNSSMSREMEIDPLIIDAWKSTLQDFDNLFGPDSANLRAQYSNLIIAINKHLQAPDFLRIVPQERVLKITSLELAAKIFTAPDPKRAFDGFIKFADQFLTDFEHASDGEGIEAWLKTQTDPLNGAIKSSFETLKAIDGRYILGSVTLMLANTTQVYLSASAPIENLGDPVSSGNLSDIEVGGIDFDPTNMNLQIKRDGKGVPLPLPQQNLEHINIEGLFPDIINIVPINQRTLPLFLGLPPKGEKILGSVGQVAVLP